MALSRKRKLALKAFLVLWGGWTVAACVTTAFFPAFTFGNTTTLAAFATLFVFAIAMAFWERLFRKAHLPPEARKIWHLKLLPLVIALIAWIPQFADEICAWIPGGQRVVQTYRVSVAGQHGEPNPTPLRLHYHFMNLGRGSSRMKAHELLITRNDAPSSRWVLGDVVEAEGWRHLLSEIAPEFSPDQREQLRKVISDSLHGRFESGLAPVNLHFVVSTHSTFPIHWGFLMAGLFSLLLLPLTWFVVRFTMFPKGVPLRE